MNSSVIAFSPIGVIHSEHATPERIPAYPPHALDCRGIAEIFPEFAGQLQALGNLSHLYLIWRNPQDYRVMNTLQPSARAASREISAVRAPSSLNGIGLSIVELILWQGNMLHLRGVDILDGTPILDIKPCPAGSGHQPASRSRWLDLSDRHLAGQYGKNECSA